MKKTLSCYKYQLGTVYLQLVMSENSCFLCALRGYFLIGENCYIKISFCANISPSKYDIFEKMFEELKYNVLSSTIAIFMTVLDYSKLKPYQLDVILCICRWFSQDVLGKYLEKPHSDESLI